ncbi:MAG: hypothetical protein JW866_03005 [Ignavibacteriales bacterium]|nr:hypothetical protein [Ignavibacteriales bacterium]
MPELIQYEYLNKELNELEKQLHAFIQRNQQIEETNSVISKELERVEEENAILKAKLRELERKLAELHNNLNEKNSSEFINIEDKQNFKRKIDDLIERIDYHLGS